MLQYVLLPALTLADKPYQLRTIAAHAPEMMAVLMSSPLAAPGVKCVLCRLCWSASASVDFQYACEHFV